MRTLAVLGLIGCAGDPTAPGDRGGDDTGATADSTAPPAAEWTVWPLDEADGGLQLRLVADGGGAWAAWFANTPTADGICDEIEVAPPPRERFPIRAARVDVDGVAPALEVASPVAAIQPTGLDLQLDADGQPAVAYTGGEPEGQYCGAHDAVLARFDGAAWAAETVMTASGDSASGDAASDAGFVVGQWPALAFDAAGAPAVLHRDVHFGSLQRDDQFRADAELSRAVGGGWSHDVVDLGDGGGVHGRLTYDPEGRLVAAYQIPVEKAESRLGVWAARLVDGTWEQVHLYAGDVRDQIALVVDDGGEISVAFTDVDARSARLRQLPAGADFTDPAAWTTERVGRGPYDEGRHVSLALAPDGAPVLAYHACQRLTDSGSSCNLNDEALVVASRQGEAGASWAYDVVQAADGASCGRYTSLVFDDAGRAWVGFRCSVPVEDGFALRPLVAWRPW